jgi:aminomethyltransferase
MTIRATPFHSRAADANRANLWEPRNGWTLSASFDDPHAEALAVRLTTAMADISWRWRATLEGARVEEFLSRLVTKDPARLAPGQAFKALWLSDGGGVRGAGVIARLGRETFEIVASAPDRDWIARAASLFEVTVREPNEGGLAVVGPYAAKVLDAAGLDPALDALGLRKSFWRGLDVTLTRFGEHGGYEIWCGEEDAPLVWDRIAKAGAAFALKPAGLTAMDIADLEAGVARPGRDYSAARDGFASGPTPWELGLESLIDAAHTIHNGRDAALAQPRMRTRVGIEFDDDIPAPRAAVMRGTRAVGNILSSLYSPALQRAIALAIVDNEAATPGTELIVLGRSARVAALPFLPVPDPIAP